MNSHTKQLQAILFTSGAPVAKKKLLTLLKCRDEELEKATVELTEACRDTGVSIIVDGMQIALTTSKEVFKVVEKIKKEDHIPTLSKTSQETLAIIAYAGPIAKVDLDFLRGVNTQYTIRRLSIRGLIQETKKGGTQLFSITVEFLTHLGFQKVEELEKYTEIRKTIQDGLSATREKMEEKNYDE